MNFTFYGHNCFLFNAGNSSFLLTDPWFSEGGAFFGSWHQYPDNSMYANKVVDISNSSDRFFVYISHEHQDHFDKEFLSKLHSRSIFIVPKFRDSFLVEQLRTIGVTNNRIIELDDNGEYFLEKNSSIRLFSADTGVNHDSAILIRIDNETFLNQNDCKIFDRLATIQEQIDYYSVQFSGATSYPACYKYSKKKSEDYSRSRSDAKIETVISAIQELRPKRFYPAAGPAVFPFHDEGHRVHDEVSVFTHQDVFDLKLKQNGIHNVSYLRPGDKSDADRSDPIQPPSKIELEHYRHRRKNIWVDLNIEFSSDKLKAAVNQRLQLLEGFEFASQPLIRFIWGKRISDQLVIDLNHKSIITTASDEKIRSYGEYIIEAEPKYFALMHDKNHRWQDISLSFRQQLSRRPDKFSNILNIFLFSDPSNLVDALGSTLDQKQERIELVHLNEMYSIDRYCPHQGADLLRVSPDKDCMIVCPRHQWKFDLQKGGKDEKHGESINAERIPPPPIEC